MEIFRDPGYMIWALAAAAAAYLFGRWAAARQNAITARFVGASLLHHLVPQEAAAARKKSYLLSSTALVLMLAALAGPQWGVELITARTKGTQIMIAVDTSISMRAEDLKPNRMQKAKSALTLLIEGLKGNRIGLIAFAGDAFIQCPLTTDTEAVKSFLRRMEAGMVPSPGTALGRAVQLAARYLTRYPGHKAIVLLSDGEDHEGEPLAHVQAAAEAGIHLYIIGMGTPEGAPIPIKNDQGKTIGYKKDEKGETVVSRLAEQSLIDLAAASTGAYYRATPLENEVGNIVKHIADLEKADLGAGAQNRFKNRYQYPLALAVLLLLLELLTSETKPRSPASAPRTAAKAGALAAAVLLAAGCSLPSDVKLHRGNKKYRAEKYEEALAKYSQADPRDAKTPFNAGAAIYKMDNFTEAQKMFEQLTDTVKVPAKMAPQAYYNLGNTLYRQKDLKGAAQAYKRCLLLDPTDQDCRHNLVLALRPPPPKDKKNQQQKPDQKKKDEEKDKKDNPDPTQPQPQQQDQGLSKEDAQRILQALKEKEKAAQQTLPKRRLDAQPSQGKKEKDW
ncbi:MAG: VWA domain-containing protein [Elusimicrobiota bacterium]